MEYTFKDKEIAKNTSKSNNFLIRKFRELFKKRDKIIENVEKETEIK